MKFSDTLKLASTKFRLRRIRLFIGVIVLVLLFSASLTALISIKNAHSSLKGFASSGINGRYLVSAQNVKPQPAFDNQEIIDLAIKKYDEAKTKEQDAYEKLGLEYIENDSLYPLSENGDGTREFTMASPYSQAAFIEYMGKFHEYTKEDASRISAEYSPLNIFTAKSFIANNDGGIFSLSSGDEDLNVVGSKSDPGVLDYSFRGFPVVDDNMIEGFFIDDFELERNEIPVVVNYEIAEQLLGLDELKNVSDEERHQRHLYIRSHINSESYQFCYRNQSSINNISTALNANSDPYSQITYNMPSDPCSPATIKTDNRSVAEKLAESQQLLVQKELGKYLEPYQGTVNFRIVGIMPNFQYASGAIESNVFDLLKKLVSSGVPSSIFSPEHLLEQNIDMPSFSTFYVRETNSSNYISALVGNSESYIVEFQTPEDAQSFIEKNNCEKEICDSEKPFKLSLFGNNSVLIDQFFNSIANVLIGAILVVCLIAFIVLFNTINRILTDSKKETAVFRAIGYKKSHIAKIYIAYIAIYSCIVYALTLVFATVTPWIINAIFSEKLGLYFTVFFDAKEYTSFNFASFEPLTLLIIIPIFLIGLFGAAIPLLISSRRDIIKNLRQE